MSVLRFESEEALRFTITSGLVPESVLAGPARTWVDERAVLVAPDVAVPAATMKQLALAGVGREPAARVSDASVKVRCWAELVRVQKDANAATEVGQVLFVLADGAALVDLAAELLRLGCDRLEWRLAGTVPLLKAAAPPYYSLLRALEGLSSLRAFVPAPPGQDTTWVELGYEHPLSRLLRPEADHVLLVSPAASDERATFTMLPAGPFADLYSLVDLHVPGAHEPASLAPLAVPPRVHVTMRLARSATTEAASLWVLREHPIATVERLMASLPEDAASALLFAVCRSGEDTIVVLRSRPGARTTLEIDGEAYQPHASIPNLFLPCDATLEPPLRRDRVRELLAPDPDAVVWLRRREAGSFQREFTPDGAFLPLPEWVEYVIDTNAPALEPWVRSCTFDFAEFVGVEAPLERLLPSVAEPETERRPRRSTQTEADPFPAPVRNPARAAPQRPVRAPALAPVVLDASAATVELAALEKELLATESAQDDPARRPLWERMGALNATLKRQRDAALCWTRAVWELPATEIEAAAAPWAAAERAYVNGASVTTLLALDAPDAQHAPALAAMTIAASEQELAGLAPSVSVWLDRHDGTLDLRTAWLVRVALSRLAGGDRLSLARARDRVLSRLHAGLSVERDVPTFLRRASAGRSAAQVDVLAGRLATLLSLFESTKRKRSATEANPKLTHAYVRFVVAFGAARLGRREWANELRTAALAELPVDDAIHGLLARAYEERIGQALAALPAVTPLPPSLWAQLNGLGKLDRYKVDRVRQASKILEPQERLDPILAFQRGEVDPRGPEFAALRGETGVAAIDAALTAIMLQARASTVEERARLHDGVMDFLLLVPHERAVELLGEIVARSSDVPPLRRVQLLEEALMIAGHLGEENVARSLFTLLEPLVAAVGPDGAAEIAPLVAGMLGTLRRCGLKEEAARLLTATQAAATGKGTHHLLARLQTASALASLGQMGAAKPVFDEALGVLARDLPMPERLSLTRATARALCGAPVEYAVAGLDQLLTKLELITDSFNTNTHVCLSVLDFVEGLVLGYASDDLVVGPQARKWLDEDEYLIRRRIHRDLGSSP